MSGYVATSHDEVLSAGLARLTSLCTVSGSPKANADGVTLVSAVFASLFAPPPGVATHSVEANRDPADFPRSQRPRWIHGSFAGAARRGSGRRRV